MDRKSHSSGDAWSSMQALYGAALPSGDGGGTPTLFAVHKTEDNDKGYYGFMATMDVYGYNLNGGQMSSAAIWINNDEGDWKQDLDAITVGWLDKSSGDWLLHYGFNSAPAVVGHFPASLFDSLSKKATDIMFGGHVRYAKGVSSPAMGSGAFPSDKAASFWDLQLIDEDGNSIPIQNDLPSLVTDKSSYSISPIEGAKFSYGGPGGKSA
ncbi:hypothetical protein PR202_ga07840 [Eleusine coracana subsp. coracana]|uniref:Neprosin PEP catalytic domain-containing protein n=1 Tax=Eleusine coracana subsp. coracana TaxID=191504 RepID=A0AAV5C0M1_ELECO|nr:hypothetical protein PR202_ga07840 [Eleusine coracana subsp. coracana]